MIVNVHTVNGPVFQLRRRQDLRQLLAKEGDPAHDEGGVSVYVRWHWQQEEWLPIRLRSLRRQSIAFVTDAHSDGSRGLGESEE